MSDEIKILIIEDDEVDQMILKRYLRTSLLNISIQFVSSPMEAYPLLKSCEFDCILTDYNFPGINGLEFYEELKEKEINIPVVIVTGMGNESLVMEAMKAGIIEYLPKDNLSTETLEQAIQNSLRIHEFKTRAKKAELELDKQERKYQTIVETVSDIIIQLDPNGAIVFANPAVECLGIQPQDMVGKHIQDFIQCENMYSMLPQIVTKESGSRATRNLEVKLKKQSAQQNNSNYNSITVMMDAKGIWDIADSLSKSPGTGSSFIGTLITARNIEDQKQIENQLRASQKKLIESNIRLEMMTKIDSLTNISNRYNFDETIEVEIKRAKRNNIPISLLMMDIDFFKQFNDTYGHQAGDDCLKKVAEAFKFTLRRSADFVARYGGEEFAVILPETNENGCLRVAHDFLRNIEALKIPHEKSKASPFVTISIGGTTSKGNGISPMGLITAADRALFESKEKGRNQVCIAP